MSHALVVGGTGMLAGATLRLARDFDFVSVVARGRRRLDALARRAADAGDALEPLCVDYRDPGRLGQALRAAQGAHGDFDLALAWIHGTAPDAWRQVLQALGPGATLWHVLGSAAADLTAVARERQLEAPAGVPYRQVILGFVLENGRSRWLTNEEISTGVLAAIADDAERHVVGMVRPWSARP